MPEKISSIAKNYAPIVLFVYNRPKHTRKTLEALSKNTFAKESELFVFADGPKEDATIEQLDAIKQTRSIVNSTLWCGKVSVVESDKNKGLADSIISGVTEIINNYGKVIVLEDDIVTGKFFLEFMNSALDKYRNDNRVWEISGFRNPVPAASKNASFFSPRESCWGWATWQDRWKYFKKDASYFLSIFTKQMIKEFNMDNANPNHFKQLERNFSGTINTWAVFWAASIYIQNGLILIPSKSLVKNIGCDGSGVHCGSNKDFRITDSIDWRITKFPDEIVINQKEYDKDKKYFRKIERKGQIIELLSKTARFVLPRPIFKCLRHLFFTLFKI